MLMIVLFAHSAKTHLSNVHNLFTILLPLMFELKDWKIGHVSVCYI